MTDYDQMYTRFGSTAPSATYEITPKLSGYWSITASTSVSFNDGAGGHVWTAAASTLLVLFAADPVPLPFKTWTTPADANAFNNDYVEQVKDNTEVLKGWTIKYEVKDPRIVDNTKVVWKSANVAGTGIADEGTGNPLVRPENLPGSIGTWQIRYEANYDALTGIPAIVSLPRTIVVSDLTVTVFKVRLPDSTLAGEGDGLYQRDPLVTDWVKPPGPGPAIIFKGQLDIAVGAPKLTKFNYGMFQTIQGQRKGAVVFAPPVEWVPLSPKTSPVGTTVNAPKSLTAQSIPEPLPVPASPRIDNITGSIFYPFTHRALGTPFQINDTPTGLQPITSPISDNALNQTNISYAIDGHQLYNLTFVDWITAYNFDTKQGAPLRQSGWTLAWDTGVPIGTTSQYEAAPQAVGAVTTALLNPTTPTLPKADPNFPNVALEETLWVNPWNKPIVGANIAPAPAKPPPPP